MEKFTAVIKRDGDWWTAYVEGVPGAHTQGKTVREALENLGEATETMLKELEDGRTYELDRDLGALELLGGAELSMPPLGAKPRGGANPPRPKGGGNPVSQAVIEDRR